ncbi:uncharacterized protein BCR38DRAFT_346659 [Pseudomassariella vexata]|uniref:DUF8004 domain-containing protein n=1 Tax=Pseudomassariella vexata TaxID=1141098 RepID=A0A1Y2DSN2_9PEZI|nr:uncharacterized protein BCR38DRAFT_346659 [Pseudomassariella vexata]ORY62278.1 hypothetical protein BCR38DRAFT_346659 [Pseudomassariella vexata]
MRFLKQLMPEQPSQPPPPPPTTAKTSPDNAFNFKETKPSLELAKQQPPIPKVQRRRSSSLQSGSQSGSQSFSLQKPGLDARPSSPAARGRSSSAQPQSNRLVPLPGARNVSAAIAAPSPRPSSSNGSQSPGREGDRRGRLRRSWLPGQHRSRSNSQDIRGTPSTSAAWILDETKADYNTVFLTSGDRVPELWNEGGSVLVFLHPQGSGQGPSFRVPPFVIDNSLGFADLLSADLTSPTSSGRSRTRSFNGRQSLSVDDVGQASPPLSESQTPGESRLYIPVTMAGSTPDLDRMMSIRNLFAFLTGQPLVGTKAQPSLFSAFTRVAGLLVEFEFTNADGSNFGDAVDMSFGFFMDQMALADVRHSREKTLEALVLGERMRSWDLWNEAFTHAVGKYTVIRDLNSPLWEQVSPSTRQKLERAHLELLTHQNAVNNRLEAFDFPSLFSGTANSTSLTEYKTVKFNIWRKSFNRMRQFVLTYYKASFGSWPPKARSKKNPFTESGLNRLVLKILYTDLCALYDLTVDRESITPRVIDQSADDMESDDKRPAIAALRRVLGEFDQSSPPVLPPLPFDVPKLPDMKSVKDNYYDLPQKDQARLEKNLQENEFLLILNKSYNFDTLMQKNPFLDEYMEFEQKEAKGKSVSEMVEQRIGHWLFLYVVIQSLPMLVVDAPGLKFTDAVEYFLCQPPKGHPPWLGDAPEVRKKWYEVSGGGGIVELNADSVEFSIEAIYHRSHCWEAAKRWEADANAAPPVQELPFSPLQAPQSVFTDMDPGSSQTAEHSESSPGVSPSPALRPRTNSPGGRSAYRSSIIMGLEELPVPGYASIDRRGSRIFSAGETRPHASRPTSAFMGRSVSSSNLHDAGSVASPESTGSGGRQGSQGGSTFDDILKDMDKKPKKKKSSLFFG